MQFSIHKNFLLNGFSFLNKEELLNYSKSISKPIFTFLSEFLSDATIVKVQTSGSTGNPKIIEIKKEFMINSAKATGIFFDLKENTTALMCLNPKYIAGKMMLIRALVLGWELDIVSPSSNPLKNIKKGYDFSAMVPLQVFNSIENLHKIKKLIVGGGVVSKGLESKLENLTTEIFATYGMTETVTHIAIKKINSVSSKSEDYVLLENVKITKDNRNCLVIDAPKVSDSLVVTNDIVNIKSDNEFEWLGRYDSIINSGGIKLIPEVIEEKLSKIIHQRFFIAGIPDEQLGEKVILVVEKGIKKQRNKDSKVQSSNIVNELGKENVISSAVEKSQKIRNSISQLNSLSKYEIPKEIYFVKVFVETATKKIQRKKTMELIHVG